MNHFYFTSLVKLVLNQFFARLYRASKFAAILVASVGAQFVTPWDFCHPEREFQMKQECGRRIAEFAEMRAQQVKSMMQGKVRAAERDCERQMQSHDVRVAKMQDQMQKMCDAVQKMSEQAPVEELQNMCDQMHDKQQEMHGLPEEDKIFFGWILV